MGKIKLRTKIEAIIVIFFLTLLAVATVTSMIRTISDTHDDIDTFIRNSNGNYWEATAGNIQEAIDDLGNLGVPNGGWGGVGGTVWLSGNTTFNISSTVVLKQHVTLDLGGSVIRPTGDFDVIEMKVASCIKNGCINVSEVTAFSHACIVPDALDYFGLSEHTARLQNIDLRSADQRGTGIYLHCINSAELQAIGVMRFSDISTSNFEYGFHIFNENTDTTEGAWINGNIFTDLVGYGDKYYIWIERNTSIPESYCANQGNYFENIQYWCNPNTECIIRNDGYGNVFTNVEVHDWDNDSGTKTSYNFTPDSQQCYLIFRGGGNDLVNNGANTNTFLNLEKGKLSINSVVETG